MKARSGGAGVAARRSSRNGPEKLGHQSSSTGSSSPRAIRRDEILLEAVYDPEPRDCGPKLQLQRVRSAT